MRLYSPVTLERVVVSSDDVGEHLKKGLVPSVTEILDIINEGEYLTDWKIRQCIQYYEVTGDKSGALVYRNTQSADFGTVCHDLCEEYLTGKKCELEYSSQHVKAIGPFKTWADENVGKVIFTERFFADGELGYGGTADMLIELKDGRLVLADLKFKKETSKYPLKASLKYKYQLTAYRNHFKKEYGEMETMNLLCRSTFVGLKTPRIEPVYYGMQDWSESFECAKKLWWEKYSQ